MNAAAQQVQHTHVVSLGGERRLCTVESFDEVCAELVAKHGGVPKVERIGGEPPPATPAAPVVEVQPKTIAPVIEVGSYDAIGDARSSVDKAAAQAAGFAPQDPVYRRGLRATGMREHRQAFDRLPLAEAAAADLVTRVRSEDRQDVTVQASELRMTKDGLLCIPGGERLPITQRALPSLVSRMGMPNGAGTFLRDVWPELRAININRFAAKLGEDERATFESLSTPKQRDEFSKQTVVLRTRKAARGGRQVFGSVSEGYTAFDVDMIAEGIRRAVPGDARAQVAYDGYRAKVDVLFFSNIVPEHAVAGEYFKVGVHVRTDDTGGGSVQVDAVVWQNLCLNFIIIDRASQPIARLRHRGSVAELAARFDEAFRAALGKLDHFRQAWGYAQEENVVERSLAAAQTAGVIERADVLRLSDLPVSQVLPGIFNGLLERQLAPLPRRDRAATVGQLMTMWERDESAATRDRDGLLTRAAVVNALTRYAHEVNADPFVEQDIERAAGSLLYARKGDPAPLPYVPLS